MPSTYIPHFSNCFCELALEDNVLLNSGQRHLRLLFVLQGGYTNQFRVWFPWCQKQILVPPASGSVVPSPRKESSWNTEKRGGLPPPFLWVGLLEVFPGQPTSEPSIGDPASVSILPPQHKLFHKTSTISCWGQMMTYNLHSPCVTNWFLILNIPVPHPDFDTLVIILL